MPAIELLFVDAHVVVANKPSGLLVHRGWDNDDDVALFRVRDAIGQQVHPIRRLDRGGTVVGLMDGMQYDEDRFQMLPGDILVAYSDGVTEPENDFGDFGEERLMEVVARYRDEPLHVISSQVMQALDAWIGADEQPDDITLVLARQL